MTPSMKFIVALVRPHKLDDVLAAVQREGIRELAVSEVRDYGQVGPREVYRGAEYITNFRPMARIESTVPANQINRITDIIAEVAQLGRPGYGRILVFDLDQEMPIRVDASRQAA